MHDERAGELPIRAIAQPRSLGDDLIIGRVHVVGELDLDTWLQAVGGHADGGADNAELADRGVEAAALAVFRLQALACAKHAPEIADVLAKHDDIVIARHHHVHRVADRLDHRPARHGQTPAC
jgi:hypothetical protein